MKMDCMYSDCCYRNVKDTSQYQEKVNHEAESSWYVKEALSQINEHQPLPDENDFIAFWNKNYQSYYEHNVNRRSSCFANSSEESQACNELDKVLTHVPPLPSYLRTIDGKKMSFIMIATTSDEGTIIGDLNKVLNETEFQAFPLSFEQPMDHTLEESRTNATKNQNVKSREKQDSMQRKKRKCFEAEEQRETFLNQDKCMLQKSESCKKTRFSWMKTKTSDREEEDKDLERQIKRLIQTKQLT